MKLQVVVKETAEAKAVKLLRDYIVSGNIIPGTRITETKLSESMNLSRATIRAALNSLSVEGLVTLTPYAKWMIAELSPQDMWELYTLRSALERLAARLAAQFIDNGDHKVQLCKAYDALVAACETGEQGKIAERDLNFHKTIIGISQNETLNLHNNLIKYQIMLFIRSSNSLISDPQEILSQHTPIKDAILAKDIDLAGRLSEAHNLSEGEKLYKFMLSH